MRCAAPGSATCGAARSGSANLGDLNAPTILGAHGRVQAGLSACGVARGAGGLDAAVAWLAGTTPAA